ncbi:hypothetical protein [Ancylobacter sp.]|uniref:hypothetical protein n=1 Tax=Ancylobacter sp. TaxID=1872567 RepID=UPI003D0F4D0A
MQFHTHDPMVSVLAIYEAELQRYNADTSPVSPEQDSIDAAGWGRIYSMEVLPTPTTLEGAMAALRAALHEEGDDLCGFTGGLIRATLGYLETQAILSMHPLADPTGGSPSSPVAS